MYRSVSMSLAAAGAVAAAVWNAQNCTTAPDDPLAGFEQAVELSFADAESAPAEFEQPIQEMPARVRAAVYADWEARDPGITAMLAEMANTSSFVEFPHARDTSPRPRRIIFYDASSRG